MKPPKKLSSRTVDQCTRLLQYLLKNGSITTLQARIELDILSPAARIFELKERGRNTVTTLVIENTDLGEHKVGKYTLLSDG